MKLTQNLAIQFIRAKLRIVSWVSTERSAQIAFNLFFTPLRPRVTKGTHLPSGGLTQKLTVHGSTVRGQQWSANPRAGNRGRALILHGFSSRSDNFTAYISGLVNVGYDVLAFDAPGHGKSSGDRLDMLIYVSMIHSIVEVYGQLSAIVAHSVGGLAATHYLETLPENENIKLVLIAPVTETSSSLDIFFKLLKVPLKVQSAFLKMIELKSGHEARYFSSRRALKSIKGPILWFHDKEDDLTPYEDVKGVQQDQHDQVTFVISTGLGHRRIYRDPSVVKQTVLFLSR